MQSHSEDLIHPKYRRDIDGLRAVAILSVLVFHSFPELLKSGFIGVDIFFVISGFLISSILFKSFESGNFSFIAFYARRVRRIFPALLIVLIASFAFGWLIFPADELKQLGKHIAGGAGFYSNFVFWKESGYFDNAADTKPLLHLWSLGIEEQFYIIWPLLLWAAWRRRFNFFLVTLLVAGISFFLNLKGIHAQDDTAGLYYSPQTRFWELLVGSMLAYLTLHPRNRGTKNRLATNNLRSLVGAGLLIIGFLLISKDKAFPGWWALLPTIGTALIISAGENAWLNRHFLSNRVLVWCGLISYPLYLWHWPLLSFARIMASETPSPLIRLAAIVMAVVLAWMTKNLVERRLQSGVRIKRSAAVLAVLMVIVGSAGFYTYLREGFPSRYGKIELKREVGRYECDNRKKDSGCVLGNPQAKKIIVIYGDSHAEHLTNAINDVLGRDYRILTVTNGSCFFGEKVVFPNVGNKKDCNAALEKLKTLRGQNIFAVIHSQRWHGYGIVQKEQIEDAIADASNAYGLHPQKVIIVGSTADVDIDCEVSNYYSRPLVGKKVCKTFEETKIWNKTFISTTRAMKEASNVHFVYPYEKVCPGDICTVIKGNISNYSDVHHLTTDGALLVMPEIIKALNE